MSEIDTKLYDAMGQRFSVVRVVGSLGQEHIATARPDQYPTQTVIVTDLKYSEAKALIKLLGERNGNS